MKASTLRLLPLGLAVLLGGLVFLSAGKEIAAEAVGEEASMLYSVGLSKIDITPDYPVRLNGFGSRRDESVGITQRIHAKAVAITDSGGAEGGAATGGSVVIVTVDNLGIRLAMVEEVARRLEAKVGLKRDRFAVTFSHSHTTPKVNGASDTIFSSPIPAEHQQHIDRYTRELTDWIEQAALEALDDRKPSRLSWSVGKVGFAKNRRTKGGSVDHDLLHGGLSSGLAPGWGVEMTISVFWSFL